MTFYGDASKNASPCGQAGFYDHFIAGFLAKIPSIFPVKLGLSARRFIGRLHTPPLFFQLFFRWYGKVSKMPNNFNIFQNDPRTDIVMHDMGCGE
jgi:hypothetical protein